MFKCCIDFLFQRYISFYIYKVYVLMILVILIVEYLIGYFVFLFVEICDILSFILRYFLIELEILVVKLVYFFLDQVRKLSCFGVMLVVFLLFVCI